MKKFKFRMQTILDIREKKLEDEQRKLASLLDILNSQLDILKEMEYRLDKISKELEMLISSDDIEIDKICNYRAFAQNISFDIQTQKELIKKTQIDIEEQREVVAQAYREEKILENLKEKQQKEHYEYFDKLEIKEVDDITISRYRV